MLLYLLSSYQCLQNPPITTHGRKSSLREPKNPLQLILKCYYRTSLCLLQFFIAAAAHIIDPIPASGVKSTAWFVIVLVLLGTILHMTLVIGGCDGRLLFFWWR